jgi:predicted esterase
MQAAAQVMHLQKFWPGAVIVYPQGLKTPSQVDPQGNFPGWQVRAGQAGLNDRDLKFFDAMLATMRQKFPVDNARIYATGFSNGAISLICSGRNAARHWRRLESAPEGSIRPSILLCHGPWR